MLLFTAKPLRTGLIRVSRAQFGKDKSKLERVDSDLPISRARRLERNLVMSAALIRRAIEAAEKGNE